MRILIVANRPAQWSLAMPGVEVVGARDYLMSPEYSKARHVRVFNICRSYEYQGWGYYVSLLAEARGHKPQPSVATIQDLKSPSLVRFYSDTLDDLIERSLAPLQSDTFTLSIYFGHNMAKRHDRLAAELFNIFPAPLLRAEFEKVDGWLLKRVKAISAGDIPDSHHDFVVDQARRFFARTHRRRKPARARYDLAILHNPDESYPPSCERALTRCVTAARKEGMAAELIQKDDIGHLAEFDALFIRETTAVMHHTYRFARRAEAEGMVVIDEPLSILRCTNKVYLAEVMNKHGVPTPRTMIVHRAHPADIIKALGLPCVLKRPDSSSSQGVVKVETEDELVRALERLLNLSDLVVAQEFVPTQFDWRVGVLDRKPLYVCRYFMAPKHWQIINAQRAGSWRYGRQETLAVETAPRHVVRTAVKAANLIGDGLYGVDLKAVGRKAVVIEVNDNPNLDAGVEDRIIKSRLYEDIMRVFVERIDARKAHRG